MITKRFHNIFDLNQCNNNIENKEVLTQFTKEVIKAINMEILKGPIVAEGKDTNPGLSVLAIIDFSHISIHTFTNNKEALIDIFSCKEYDRDIVLKICKKYFATTETKVRKKEVWWNQ